MRRDIDSITRNTLVLLLFAGCADNDTQSGLSATEPGESSTASAGASTAGTGGTSGVLPETSTGVIPTTGMTGAVSATTGGATGDSTTGPGTGDAGSSESGTQDTGDTTGTGTTGAVETTGETSGETGEDTAAPPSFAADIYPIFDDNCSCHEDDNGAGKLRLAKDDAYTNMIDMPSDQLPEMMLVAPGSSMKSYLWHKLNNTQKDVGGEGKKMPPGGLLDKDDLALIQLWIDEGAKP